MRKLLICLTVVLIAISTLSAASIPAPGIRETASWVRHPGLLVELNEKTRFSIEASFGSDIDGLSFLANPVGKLQKAADYLRRAIEESSDDFLIENYGAISDAFSFDPGFPAEGNTGEETAYFIREYFKDGGRFDSLDDANKARAVVTILREDLVDFPSSLITSGITMDLAMGGGEVKNHFGWNWNVNFFFDGASSLLPQMSTSQYTYGNEFGLSFGGDVGYALYIYKDILSIGFSASPQIYFRSSFLNADYIDARLSGNPFSLLASNIFYLGVGLDLNLGMLYRINEEIALSFDLRHIPSVQTYWYFTAADFMESFSFHHDKNFYFEPFDATVTVLMDFGYIRAEAGICNIFDQFIVQNLIDGYDFDFWTILRAHVEYDLKENLMLYAGYERRMLSFGVETEGFKAELATPLDRFGFRISAGYSF